MTTQNPVGGRQSAPYGLDRYRSWVRTTGQRYRRDIDVLIADTLAELLTEDAASHLGPLAPHHVNASNAVAAEIVLDGRHGVPLRVRGGPDGAVHTLHTRAARREWREAWARHVARLHDRAVAYAAEIHRQFDQVDYTAPVAGSDGQVLTGQAELDDRYRRWGEFIDGWHYSAGQSRVERQNKAKRRTALTSTRFDPTPRTLSSDIGIAREQLMDQLDDAAAGMRRWLLDGGRDAANAVQRGAIERLEEQRQAGRRSLRTAATLTALGSAATAAEGRVRGVGIGEDAPVHVYATIEEVDDIRRRVGPQHSYLAPGAAQEIGCGPGVWVHVEGVS